MVFNIFEVKEKNESCTYLVDVFCTVKNKIIECQMDRLGYCANCDFYKKKK